jgi:MOSC domain-containing protein YiiM
VAPGTVEHIHLTPTQGAPVEPVERAETEAGLGIRGDRYFGDPEAEQLTLIEAEAIERLAAEHDVSLGPGGTRRNLTTRGIDLGSLIGRRFRVGEAVCEGLERCEPCLYLAKLTDPRVLRGLVHTGLSAAVLEGGTIRVGDPVEVLP